MGWRVPRVWPVSAAHDGTDLMSAWLCTDLHISALVQAAQQEGIIALDKDTGLVADNLWAQMKWDNLYSLNQRYGDPLDYEDWTNLPNRRTTFDGPLHLPAIWKQISCWMYQCAEFDGWDETYAHSIMRQLQKHIEIKLTGSPVTKENGHFADGNGEERYFDLGRQADEHDPSGHAWGISTWHDVAQVPAYSMPEPAPDAHLDDIGD